MRIQGVDPQSGDKVVMTCVAQSEDEIRDLLKFDLSEEALKRRLNQLNVSADIKSILFTLAKTTIQVGSLIVRIGRSVLDMILNILGEFPMTATGTVFGAIFGQLVVSVPILGLVFGPFIAPLALAFGFAVGAMHDFNNRSLANRIAASVAKFDSLKPRES